MSGNVAGLLPELYGCADQPSNWHLVLDQICRQFKARSAVIQVLHRADNLLYPEWDLRDSQSSEHAELHDRLVNNEHNPRLNLNIARVDIARALSGTGAILRDEERFETGCPHLKRLRERLAMIGLGRSIAIALKMPGNRHLTLLLHRALGDGREFAARDEESLWELAPHLKQVVNLFEKMNALRDDAVLAKEFADRINTGIIVLDCHGTVLWRNQCAETIVRKSRHLTLASGKLRCANVRDQCRISRFLSQVSSLRQQLLMRIGAPRCNPIQVLAVPLRLARAPIAAGRPHDTTVALLLSDPGCKAALSPSDIRELFGLTPAEAALAAGLGEGLTLQDYAERRGVSVGTARIQLKSILSKTGAGRQPELMRLLYASVSARTLAERPQAVRGSRS